MAHQSLYRRYRPGKFSEVRGQDHVVEALRNAVAQGTEGHAYLFSGPRGTGKTSTARILAKALNCHNVDNGEPCGSCPSCEDMDAGRSFDLFELDAASNNGVDAIRDLVERTAIGSPGRTKVYILDEVHMLSTGASNALLKTLEEPPSHVRFVLATTDPQKVLPTIKSRTQHFEFRLLSAEELEQQVRFIIGDAGLSVDEESIGWVVNQGRGSARDTLSALDQVVAAGGVLQQEEPVDQLYDAWMSEDAGAAIVAVNESLAQGHDPRVLAKVFLDSIRDTFLVSLGAQVPHLRDEDRERHQHWAEALGTAKLTKAMESVGSAAVEMRQAVDPRVPLEVALLRLISHADDGGSSGDGGSGGGPDFRVKKLIERVDALEAALAAGGSAAPRSALSQPSRSASEKAAAPSSAPPPQVPGRPRPAAAEPVPTTPQEAPESSAPETPAHASTPEPDSSPTPSAPTSVDPENVSAETPAAPEPARIAQPEPEPQPAPAASPTQSSTDEVALLNSKLRDHFVESMARSSRAYFRDGAFVDAYATTVVFSLATGVPETQAQRHLGVLSVLVSDVLGRQVEVVLGSGDVRQPARVPRPDDGAISDAVQNNRPAPRGNGPSNAPSSNPQQGNAPAAPPTPPTNEARSAPRPPSASDSSGTASREIPTPPRSAVATRTREIPQPPSAELRESSSPFARPAESRITLPTLPERNESDRDEAPQPTTADDHNDDDYDVDFSELEDATGVAQSAIDLLLKAFPGATIEEKDDGI